jgi:hypothetical protein
VLAAGCLWIVYYIHMELGLVLRETLGLEIMASFATQSEVFDIRSVLTGWGEWVRVRGERCVSDTIICAGRRM